MKLCKIFVILGYLLINTSSQSIVEDYDELINKYQAEALSYQRPNDATEYFKVDNFEKSKIVLE